MCNCLLQDAELVQYDGGNALVDLPHHRDYGLSDDVSDEFEWYQCQENIILAAPVMIRQYHDSSLAIDWGTPCRMIPVTSTQVTVLY